jgi:hypothetical protein
LRFFVLRFAILSTPISFHIFCGQVSFWWLVPLIFFFTLHCFSSILNFHHFAIVMKTTSLFAAAALALCVSAQNIRQNSNVGGNRGASGNNQKNRLGNQGQNRGGQNSNNNKGQVASSAQATATAAASSVASAATATESASNSDPQKSLSENSCPSSMYQYYY